MKENTVKKGAKKTSKKADSSFEKYVKQYTHDDQVVDIQDGEFNVKILVKQHIALAARMSLMDNMESIFFPSGDYDPLYGWKLFDFLIFQLYTDVQMKNDLETFDKLYCNEKLYSLICMNYPPEVSGLREDAENKLKYLVKRNSISAEQSAFYRSFSDVMNGLDHLVSTLDSSLSAVSNKVSGLDSFNVQDLLHAMEMMEKKDESKIVNAVLDFQKEKARVAEREALRVDVSKSAD